MTREEFKTSYLPLSEALYRVARYLLESDADAQDAVQDLFIKLWDSRDSLDAVQNPHAYCVTLMRNLCIDRIRRASKARKVELPESISSGPTPEKECIEKERLTRVMAIVESLPERQRRVVRMRIFEEMSYEEIAKATGMSNLTLRVLLSTARKKIKEQL